jgi:hypothetical protein
MPNLRARQIAAACCLITVACLSFGCSNTNEQAQSTPDVAALVERARKAGCAEIRNRLLVVDGKYVLWERRGRCPDSSYACVLFAEDGERVLCRLQDSIAGPRLTCPSENHKEMFETMTENLDDPHLGLGPAHRVEEVPF